MYKKLQKISDISMCIINTKRLLATKEKKIKATNTSFRTRKSVKAN